MQLDELIQRAATGDGCAAGQLAAALKIDVVWYPGDVWAHSGPHDASVEFALHGGDRHAAMVQAIFRVATALTRSGHQQTV